MDAFVVALGVTSGIILPFVLGFLIPYVVGLVDAYIEVRRIEASKRAPFDEVRIVENMTGFSRREVRVDLIKKGKIVWSGDHPIGGL